MSPRRSNRIVPPSGETSTSIQVPSSVVNSTLRAFSGTALTSSFAGFFASPCTPDAFSSAAPGAWGGGRTNRTRRAGHGTTRRKRIIVGRLMLRLRSLVQQGVEAADDIMHAHGTPDRPLRPGGGVLRRRRRGRRDDDPGGGHGPHRPVPAPLGDRSGGPGRDGGRQFLLRSRQAALLEAPDAPAPPQSRAGRHQSVNLIPWSVGESAVLRVRNPRKKSAPPALPAPTEILSRPMAPTMKSATPSLFTSPAPATAPPKSALACDAWMLNAGVLARPILPP